MIRLGLTGGIGMGKSTVSAMFATHGVPGFNADEEVHRLQAPDGGAIPALAAAFPGMVAGNVLDRAKLRALVLGDAVQMRRLEEIMHPLVRAAQARFLEQAEAEGHAAVLLDIPLLFENKLQTGLDKVVVVSCPREVQIERVAKRGLPAEQIEAIIARQMPDAQKRALADYVIETGGALAETEFQVKAVLKDLDL